MCVTKTNGSGGDGGGGFNCDSMGRQKQKRRTKSRFFMMRERKQTMLNGVIKGELSFKVALLGRVCVRRRKMEREGGSGGGDDGTRV